MNKFKKILAALGILFLGVLAGWLCRGHFAPDTNVATKIDTLVVRDTFTYPKPTYITRKVTDTIYIIPPKDTVQIHDTIIMFREQRYYRSNEYQAWVSGIDPELDSIKVFPETRYITRTIENSKKNALYAGAEIMYSDRVATSVLLAYEHRWKYLYINAGVGYDVFGKHPVALARLSVPVFQW